MNQNPHQQFQQRMQQQQRQQQLQRQQQQLQQQMQNQQNQQRQRQMAGYAWEQQKKKEQQQREQQMRQQQQVLNQQPRQQQMLGNAWQQQGNQPAYVPVAEARGGCARTLAAIGTFVGTLVVLGLVCGGAGFLAGGILGQSDDTAMLGLIAGGLIAFIGAGISANKAANS